MIAGYGPWLGLLGAVLSFGTFAVPMKAPALEGLQLHALTFQMYVSLGVCISSLLLLLLPGWQSSYFTYLGFVSAFMWSVAMLLIKAVVELLGVSVGQGIWSGCVALVSFVEGIAYGNTLSEPTLAMGGMALLTTGIVGLALVGGMSSSKGNDSLEDPLLVTEKKSSMQAVLGVFLAFCVGVLCGSLFVPMQYTDMKGADQIFFSVSLGVGAVLSSVFFLILHKVLHLFGFVAPLGNWEIRKAALPGMASGVLWNLGNTCTILGMQPPLSMAVGYPLSQCCILVSGIWGVAYYKEITGAKAISMFFVWAIVLLLGASVLGVFGSS